MLDVDTKRRIDTARDILVGKVPDPKSQVEQITIALIYKFMDDIDADAEELGGQRQFFAGDFERYGWPQLVRAGLGGHEVLNLYAEAIARMPENPGIPPLFRDIFNNAYLPYRDPETLRAFLKEIDSFRYDHSERLGDAFEYLLSVLGAQGDAGQFRTPRHIIDFMVAILDPKKDETILDPACGTAGFLVSSYKHILKANTDAEGHSTLTPDEKGKLATNFNGYDISPDMVRLSLVNLYLHGFVEPHIAEYDTLTSEERWTEYADVILANPPFMSPKGGIRPHRRFSVQSKRSEVLFVDYMAEHLTPTGRAGIIVPEGIIFQNQTAHKRLRKMLVENYLVAVISVPAGVFQPYSGVKTSILILDKLLAKKTEHMAFFKVENDGFDLGAQRRPIGENDLPQVQAEVIDYLSRLRVSDSVPATRVAESEENHGLIIEKEKISADGDYNLSGERYRENSFPGLLKWPLVKIDELCVVERGASPRPIRDFITQSPDGVNWIKIGDSQVGSKYIFETAEKITQEGAERSRRVKPGDLVLSNSMSYGRPYIMATDGFIHDGWLLLREKSGRLDKDFLYHILGSDLIFAQFERAATGGVVNNLNSGLVRKVEIPLPPLEIQREIVAEIESYQRVIDGARAVIDNYRPQIAVDPEWPTVAVGEICVDILSGGTPSTNNEDYWKGDIPWITSADIVDVNSAKPRRYITEKAITESATNLIPRGNIIVVTRVGLGKLFANDFDVCISQDSQGLILKDVVSPYFLVHVLRISVENFKNISQGTTIQGVTKSQLSSIKVPLPPLDTQTAIVTELEAEQALVNANRELAERFEKKVRAVIGQVWGQ
ncbi:MAG: N-6 DNA methylase [Candidatus Tectomicrobia bacterium]|nr:N-6 DNA methylase [Candidatus Tectomicrobia bacterium]